MNVKILFIKELTVVIHFWISCPMLTGVSGENMTLHIMPVNDFTSLYASVGEHAHIKEGVFPTGLREKIDTTTQHLNPQPRDLSWLLGLILLRELLGYTYVLAF